MFGGFDSRSLPVEFGEWFRPLMSVEPCHTVDVYLRAQYKLYNVRVVATENLTVLGESFPATDELASFRIAEPVRYRFETRAYFNPECCTERPPRPEEQETPWFPLEGHLFGFPFTKDSLWFDDLRGWHMHGRLKTSFTGSH